MSTFDIKKFLIKEGLTRVSRDRKKLLKEGFEEGADLTKRILNVIQQDDELGQVLEVRPGHQWEDVIGDWEPDEVTVETEHGSDDPMQVEPGRYIFVDGDFEWNLEDEVGEEIPWTYRIWYSGPTASYVTYMYRLPEDLDEARDRKRLLKETGPADWTEEDRVWIDLAEWWSSLYFRLVGYANADADYDGPRTEILQIGNYIVTADLESDDDSPEKGNTYINGQEATTEEIAKIVKLIESYVDAHKMNQIKLSVVTDDDLNEESDRELATRVSKIVHANPKGMTNGVRRKSNGSTTAGNWNGMGSANQDTEYRKEQAKQNAKLKKQLGIKTKPMSREDWITKKLNKELGL